MKILVLHDHVPDQSTPDHADALAQSRAVCAALELLGHEWMTLGLTLDLEAARAALQQLQPDLVFNLVESLDGQGRFIHLPLHLLDSLKIPYTGVLATSMIQTTNKLFGKQVMRAADIPTPKWWTMNDLHRLGQQSLVACTADARVILKSVWEHASIGIGGDSVMQSDSAAAVRDALESRLDALGGEAFVEQFIDGREFNLALLAGGESGPELLPPCEIVFEDFGDDRPRIVNYNAKWDEHSFEYAHTPRKYDFDVRDRPLLERMQSIALHCWQAFDLRGHARVDFRVDRHGQPWVLEVNANPCLSTDAGFAAALDRAGMPYATSIHRIVQDSLRNVQSLHQLQP